MTFRLLSLWMPAVSGTEPELRRTSSGPGKVLVAVYAVFAIAATARAGVQLVTRYAEAPTAYLLSAFAAVVYIVATVTLALGTRTSRIVALVAISIELLGVLDGRDAQPGRPRSLPARHRVVGIRHRVRLRTTDLAYRRSLLVVVDPPRPGGRRR